MWDVVSDMGSTLDALSAWQKILVGIGFSVLGALLVRILIWAPSKWVVNRTEADWDDAIMKLATPLLNYATFLLGLYLTVVWAIDGDSIIASTMATLVILILMFLTGRFFSKLTSQYLPGALEVMDDKADLGLSGGSTIIVGLAKGFIWGSAILLILAHLNVDITAALASLTIFSLVIGMAMQESASNFIISAQLMIDKPYEVGDKIEVNMIVGTVIDVGFLSTKIRTSRDQLVIVPNKMMATTVVTNFAKGGPKDSPRRVNLRLDVGVGYDESPSHVKTVLREIIDANKLVLNDPGPTILLISMMHSSLTFRINCWVEDYSDEWVAKDQIQCEILSRFEQENIEIPFPHVQLKYEPRNESDADVRIKKLEEQRAQEEKIRRQDEAHAKEAEVQAKEMEARAAARKRAEEIRALLENEETEEEIRLELSDELSKIEENLNVSEDD